MEILKLENVKKYYGSENNITKAVNDLSLKVNEGEFVAIMGASGSGKTTLLNCISTIDEVTSGHIYVGSEDITELKEKELAKFRRENLGFIFQDFNLLNTLTISENISLALIINKDDPNEVDKKVKDIASKLGISEILNKYPYEVSGGQKQRCACARALINKPKLILADEPTGALDSKSSRMLLETMDEMNEKLNATILMVTHDAFTASYATRVIFIKDGKIVSEINETDSLKAKDKTYIISFATLKGLDSFKKSFGKMILKEEKMNDLSIKISFEAKATTIFLKSLSRYKINDIREIKVTLEDKFLSFYNENKTFEGV